MLLLFTACLTDVKSQSREGFIEAYRNGTLSEAEIDELKQQYRQHDADANKSRSRSVSNNENLSPARSDVSVQGDEKVFGQSLFRNKNLTFEPDINIATPEDYLLGTGDEVIIDLWGDTQLTLRSELSPEGSIVLTDVGPVSLAGLTIKQAEQRLRRALMNNYEGLADGSVKMLLSLGKIRSIKVDVVGEVAMPGSYTLPSLATLFHALYLAGGVSDIGSLRTIALFRGGKQVAEVDMYDYIISGRNDQDVALRGGDLIVVPTYNCLVNVAGAVKRPMHYEMRRGETLAEAIALQPEHISAYNLMYEEGTAMHRALERGDFEELSEEENVEQFQTLIKRLKEEGYRHYEISNFARPGYESRHNSSYWNDTPYIGCGAAAHSYDGTSREWNVADIKKYIKGINSGCRDFEREHLSEEERYNDTILTRLRTADGIPLAWMKEKFSEKLNGYMLRNAVKLIDSGNLKEVNGHLALTEKGIFVSDAVIRELIFVE